MFDLSMSPWEFVMRAVVVFLFLFVMLRLGGKKHIGELTPFDLVVLLIVSEAWVFGALIDTGSRWPRLRRFQGRHLC
jgi:uncharacterized membrane protein YcaP (DUF421 family)